MSRRNRRVFASFNAVLTAGALAVAPVSCKDDPKENSAKGDKDKGDKGDKDDGAKDDGAKDSGDKEPKPAADGGKEQVAADDEPPGSIADRALAAVGAGKDITPAYPVDLDPLLDMIPADAEGFLVVRDAGGLMDTMFSMLGAERPALDRLAKLIESDDPAEAAEFRDNLGKVDKFEAALGASGIDLALGGVVGKRKNGQAFFVYGAKAPDALVTLATTMGDPPNKKKDCSELSDGYVVCVDNGMGAYAPGKRAKELRTELAASLPGMDPERGNIVGLLNTDDGIIPLMVETGQGMAHITFVAEQAREPMAKFLEPSKAPALGLVGPGEPFMWGQGSKKAIMDQAKGTNPIAENIAKTLTGEALFAGLSGSHAIFMGIGVDDPAPASGLVGMASLAFDKAPKTLPDGTKLGLEVKAVEAGGKTVQTVHATFSGSKAWDFAAKLGYANEAFAFSGGQFAGATFGGTEEVVKTIVGYSGTGPSSELLESLPVPLSKALSEGRTSLAAHLPFDSMQSQETRELFASIEEVVPPDELPPVDMSDLMDSVLPLAAPLSSVSMWVSDVDKGPVFHVVVQGFADASTPEGKAATEAMKAVAGGADPAATYAALASSYSSSSRAWSYRARAGSVGDPMASAIAAGVVLGGVGALFFARKVEEGSGTIAVPSSEIAAPPK